MEFGTVSTALNPTFPKLYPTAGLTKCLGSTFRGRAAQGLTVLLPITAYASVVTLNLKGDCAGFHEISPGPHPMFRLCLLEISCPMKWECGLGRFIRPRVNYTCQGVKSTGIQRKTICARNRVLLLQC